uniref:Uncharacterized protein n=1 Tax=Cyanophora sudae TaxID=1522369 RepID=A0A2Z4HG35_9EUKA|nr:hypothetical protein [Cyanophora sudae]AWW13750.1 hypothetical protein [Cyanophora sudae]
MLTSEIHYSTFNGVFFLKNNYILLKHNQYIFILC